MRAIRVSVLNNFNCTKNEWAQLQQLESQYPNDSFFVNSNIRTPNLLSVNNHPNKVVITVNPDITPNYAHIRKLDKIDHEKVAFLRLKWIPSNNSEIRALLEELSQKYPIVITVQRFHETEHLLQYTHKEHYHWSDNNFRLTGPALQEIQDLVDELARQGRRVWICDRKGLGCQGCGLCARLATGQDVEVTGVNLSSSGLCPYNCPDCYAKRQQYRSVRMGHKPLTFDVIHQNDKQAGRTKHIQKRAAAIAA